MRRQIPWIWFMECMHCNRGDDYPSAYCGHRCCSHPCRHIPWSYGDSTFCRHLDRLWHGQELQDLPQQRHLCKPGGDTITIITCVSRILWLRYNIRLHRQWQNVVFAGVAYLWRHYGDICVSVRSSFSTAGYPRRSLPQTRLVYWLLSGMTKPVFWALSMRDEGNCSVTKVEQWTNCHPPMMLCCSIPDAYSIKQEFERPAHKHSLWTRHNWILPGLKYHSHGYQFGWQFKKFSHRAGSWSNCPSKMTAPTTVVVKQICTGHHYAS